jgi:hypothetical protein
MGIEHISLLKPDDFPLESSSGSLEPEEPPAQTFFVSAPDGNGIFSITGPSDVVVITGATTFTLNTPLVTNNGDGSYTATST